MTVLASGVTIGHTYFVNLYSHPKVPTTFGGNFHETFEEAVQAARHELSVEPDAKLLHILECSPIKGLEPLELYP